jgi:hypothetical protein
MLSESPVPMRYDIRLESEMLGSSVEPSTALRQDGFEPTTEACPGSHMVGLHGCTACFLRSLLVGTPR